MRKLIMWNIVSLDGYFEGVEHWDLPWHEKVWGEELERLSLEQLGAADMLVFGRVTYEGMAAHWTPAEGAIADYMNRLPKLVCSRTLETADWNNSTLVGDGAAGEIARLKKQGNGDMYVFGSADLSKTLIREGLYDEYRIGVAPVLHGRGRLLFSEGHAPQNLRLLEASTVATGCVVLRYAADRVT